MHFSQAAVEVMLSGRDTEEIQAETKTVCPFFVLKTLHFMVKLEKEGVEKVNEQQQ